MIFSYLLNMQSHPSWVCGLKPDEMYNGRMVNHVTPFVGVWIETTDNVDDFVQMMSHPSWVCGLKQLSDDTRKKKVLSHPSWVCGLKHHLTEGKRTRTSHTLRGCVD